MKEDFNEEREDIKAGEIKEESHFVESVNDFLSLKPEEGDVKDELKEEIADE